MKYGKVDRNQKAITEALRDLGISVSITSDVAKGFPDIIVGFRGENYLIELKSGKGKQEDSQIKFESLWTGQYSVCRTLDEVLEAIGYNGFDIDKGKPCQRLMDSIKE